MVGLICLPFLRVLPGRMPMILTFALCCGALFLIPLNIALSIAGNVGALAVAEQLTVPFAVILSILFLGETVHLPRILGLAMAFAGVFLIGFDPAMRHEGPALALNSLSSLILACGSLLTRKLRDVPVATLYAWIGLVGAAILGPLCLAVEPQAIAGLGRLPMAAWGWIAFSAVGSSLLGHGGLSWMVQRHPIGVVMPYTLIAPVLSVMVSAVMFDTPVTGLMLLGGAIVLGGVAIVTIRTAAKGDLVEEIA